jgi:2'-5' RNA ligase
MADNLVIVAIPDETDRVWKVSSEKVPHMTLLFLGDSTKVNNLDSIMQFVGYAAERSLKRFSLPVDHRGELGADQADVLFFKKSRYDFQAVREFRSLLLKDDNIRTAYDGATQFETPESVGQPGQAWIPHLTLGYPAAPAKPMPDDWSPTFYDVQFNKIAVWTGNYEGPEFLLKDYWDDMDETLMDAPLSVAMSNIEHLGAEFLSHYGKKGMKWGVRNEETRKGWLDPEGVDLSSDVVKSVLWPLVPPLGIFAAPAQVRLVRGGARGVKAKAIDVQEQRFAKKAHTDKNFVEIHNRSIERSNREIAKINEKHKGDLTKDPKKQKAYDAEVQKMMQDSYREAANSIGNKANTMHLDLEFKNDGLDFKINAKPGASTPIPSRVKHADDDDTVEYTGKIKRAPTGHILGLEFDDFKPQQSKSMAQSDEDTVTQTIDLGAAWLAHYGVKGMRWGVRRPGAVTTQTHIDAGVFRRRTKVQAKGGVSQDAHPDAVKAAVQKQVLKKSGTAALSNQDLRELNTRLQLEAQVHQLTTKKGQRAVQKQLEEEGKQQLSRGVRTGVKKAGPSAFRKARKGAATAATIAALA